MEQWYHTQTLDFFQLFNSHSTHAHTLCSQYQVNISETHSSLSLYSGWDYTEYTALAHIPLRPPSDYHSLSDIFSTGQSMDGSHVNIQAVVKHVSDLK